MLNLGNFPSHISGFHSNFRLPLQTYHIRFSATFGDKRFQPTDEDLWCRGKWQSESLSNSLWCNSQQRTTTFAIVEIFCTAVQCTECETTALTSCGLSCTFNDFEDAIKGSQIQ